MKVILTGITGNLGYEVASDLIERGITVIPVVRPGKARDFDPVLYSHGVIEHDLLSASAFEFSGVADCILHSAGVVHFKDAGTSNERMVLKLVDVAKRLRVPFYFVSTAFVYPVLGLASGFHNSYEEDKWRAEQALAASGVPHAIFRPSILVGHSVTGRIQNFSGYYLVARAFLDAIRDSVSSGRTLRFPRLFGTTNLVPVDQAARCINDIVERGQTGSFYVTNPDPSMFDWMLQTTLELLGVYDDFCFTDSSFETFGAADLTPAERKLYRFGVNFNPYWSVDYSFPSSLCEENLINCDYLARTLNYFVLSFPHFHGSSPY